MPFIPPTHLYKYKSLSRDKDLERTLAIIETNTIYASPIEKLNDPMEGKVIVPASNYAGVSLTTAIEKTPSCYSRGIKSCRIISLTENPASPQMWAYYADGYKGVCLQFGLLPFCVEPIHYAQRPYRVDGVRVDSKDGQDISRARLLTKHIDWSHEEEWRAVFTEECLDEYVWLGEGNPNAVIVGHLCESDNQEAIRGACKNRGIPLYTTYISDWILKVRIVPFGFNPICSGIPLDEQIRVECERQGIPPFELEC